MYKSRRKHHTMSHKGKRNNKTTSSSSKSSSSSSSKCIEKDMILQFEASGSSLTSLTQIGFTLNFSTGTSLVINWGDGLIPTTVNGPGTYSPVYTYTKPGSYTVKISGKVDQFAINVGNTFLRKICSFGDLGISNLSNAFAECDNLIEVPKYLPTTIINLNSCFSNCYNLIGKHVKYWDVSNVTDMENLFLHCAKFCGDISKWNVSNVITMKHMLDTCIVFDSDISRWKPIKVITMSGMLDQSGLSIRNYNRLLVRWSSSSWGFVNTGIILGAKNLVFSSKYSIERTALIAKFGLSGGISGDYFN